MSDRNLVAGVGFRHGAPSGSIVALIRRALAEAVPAGRLVAIATASDRARDPAIREAAAAFGLVPIPVEPHALEGVDSRVPTRSARIERLRGVGSLAEAAAIALAGATGTLVLARIDDGQATCALAAMGVDATAGGAFTSPVAGKGGPQSGSGDGSDASGSGVPLSRSTPTRDPPSPATGRGERAETSRYPKSTTERAMAAQIADRIP